MPPWTSRPTATDRSPARTWVTVTSVRLASSTSGSRRAARSGSPLRILAIWLRRTIWRSLSAGSCARSSTASLAASFSPTFPRRRSQISLTLPETAAPPCLPISSTALPAAFSPADRRVGRAWARRRTRASARSWGSGMAEIQEYMKGPPAFRRHFISRAARRQRSQGGGFGWLVGESGRGVADDDPDRPRLLQPVAPLECAVRPLQRAVGRLQVAVGPAQRAVVRLQVPVGPLQRAVGRFQVAVG